MTTYDANIDMGEGGATTIEAANLAEAVTKAEAWAKAGEWKEDGAVIVRVSGPDGDERIDVNVTANN